MFKISKNMGFLSLFGFNEQKNIIAKQVDNVKNISKAHNDEYIREIDGTHTYFKDQVKEMLNRLYGENDKLHSRTANGYLWAYYNVSFLASCVDLYTKTICSGKIYEVNAITGENQGETPFIKLLNKPNNYQTQDEFLANYVQNYLCNGLAIIYPETLNSDLKKGINQIHCFNFYDFEIEQTNKQWYSLENREFKNLKIINKDSRDVFSINELLLIYDVGIKKESKKGYISVLNPISRLDSIKTDINIIYDTTETMHYLGDHIIHGLLTKKTNANELAPLSIDDKNKISKAINSFGNYKSRKQSKGNIIPTNESFEFLDLIADFKKTGVIDIQDVAKNNIRGRFDIAKELLETTQKSSSRGTFENQQRAEGRFITTNAQVIVEKLLDNFHKRYYEYFNTNKTKLIISFDHLPSIATSKLESEANVANIKIETAIKALDLYKLGLENNIPIDIMGILADNKLLVKDVVDENQNNNESDNLNLNNLEDEQ